MFTGLKSHHNDIIATARVWGCPAYVLDPKLQDGKKLPKWTKHSRQAMYLGSSPSLSTTVGRMLNLATGAITPQYHIVYDELFATVHGTLSDSVFDAALWNDLLSLGGLELTLNPTDVHGDQVPFQEFYDDFVDLSDTSTSVSEGDDEFETTHSVSEKTFSRKLEFVP